ncbi:MAG: hypothetical protein QM737_02390 [Ferruginibacter sp.]
MEITKKEFKDWLINEAKQRVEKALKKTVNQLSETMKDWPLAYKEDIVKSIPTTRRLKRLLAVAEEKEDYETCKFVMDELKRRE